jgi:hypothetical protein
VPKKCESQIMKFFSTSVTNISGLYAITKKMLVKFSSKLSNHYFHFLFKLWARAREYTFRECSRLMGSIYLSLSREILLLEIRCQFHQHFCTNFSYERRFGSFSLVMFLVTFLLWQKIRTKNTCNWWNWRQGLRIFLGVS